MTQQRLVARFDSFEFDFDRLVLRDGGNPVRLQPQPTKVLAALLREPGRLVTRDEIRSRAWGERILEFDAALNFSIRQIREALRDNPASPSFLETVPRRGYRFIAPVRLEPATGPAGGGRRSARGIKALGIAAGAVLLLGIGLRFTDPTGRHPPPLSEPMRTTFRAAQWLYDQGDFTRALSRLDSVRLAQPDYAEAWALTALTHLRLGEIDAARSAAARAVATDPELARGHYALGRARFREISGEGAMQAFHRAVELDPNDVSYRQWYAQTLANALRFDDAIAQLEAARAIDPLANTVRVDLAFVYLAAGRIEQASALCSESIELVPAGASWARDCLMTAHALRGDSAAAVAEARALMRLDRAPTADISRVRSLVDYFRWDLARIDSLLAEDPRAVRRFARVRATARLRDRSETLRGLRAMREARDAGIQWAPRDVWFRFLHGDPDFGAFLREAGLPVPVAPAPPAISRPSVAQHGGG